MDPSISSNGSNNSDIKSSALPYCKLSDSAAYNECMQSLTKKLMKIKIMLGPYIMGVPIPGFYGIITHNLSSLTLKIRYNRTMSWAR